jgi:hypothetical protein
MTMVLTTSATLTCLHSGQVKTPPSQTRVLVMNAPVLVQSDIGTVAGCPFATSQPSPCTAVTWASAATRVLVNFTPVLTSVSTGFAANPNAGPTKVMATVTQTKVQAT